LTTAEIFPPTPQGYMPITGTIFDLLDQFGVNWVNYFSDLPTSFIFKFGNQRVKSVSDFLSDAAAGTLPPVSFVDPSFMPDPIVNGLTLETDEHPPHAIRAGQYFVSQIVHAARDGPTWQRSNALITQPEHGRL